MWFLLRMAFWLTVVVALLPITPSQQKTSADQVGAKDALSAAIAVLSDIHQFCERQPSACATGSQTIVQFGHKVQTGADLLYQFVHERMTADQSTAPAETTNKSLMREPSSSTLTPADLGAPGMDRQNRVSKKNISAACAPLRSIFNLLRSSDNVARLEWENAARQKVSAICGAMP